MLLAGTPDRRVGPRLGFFLYGMLALIAQLLCLQELLIVFSGHELFLGFSLGAWMGWVGVGSFLARRLPAQQLRLAVVGFIPLLVANLVVIRLSKCLFGFGMLVGLIPMLLFTVVLLAPIGLAVGALFSWGYEYAQARATYSLGSAYFWDALGTACGGVLYSWLIAGRLSPEWAIVCLAVPVAVLSACLVSQQWKRIAVVLTTIAVALLFAASPLPRFVRQLQWRGYTLIAERLSRYSHLALARTGSLVSLFENGVISSHFPDPAAYEELVHWPLLAHPSPHRVLVIGGAATGTLTEILKHPVAQVDYVELDPAIVQLLEPVFTTPDRAALDDPRVRLFHLDGRRFLATIQEHYDVILLRLPEPLNAQINRLYTREAFSMVREHLAPGGLFAFTIPSSENYLSPETIYFNASLYQTLKAAFPTVELVAGDPLLVLASVGAVDLRPAVLIHRYEQRSLRTREVVPSYFPIKLDDARRAALLHQLRLVHLSLINRDFSPVCYASAWRVWLAKFVSPIYFLGSLALLVLVVMVLRVVWRRRAVLVRLPGPAALFVLGFAGIVCETVLLLAFQALNGYVYWQLGSLFAAFMLGLASGSAIAVRSLSQLGEAQVHWWLRGLLVVTGCESLGLAWILPIFQRLPIHVPWLVLFGFLLAVTGLWLGLAFPLASRTLSVTSPSRLAGSLYAADLWGASLGAVLTSACFVPLLGFIPTVSLTGLMLLLAAWRLPAP